MRIKRKLMRRGLIGWDPYFQNDGWIGYPYFQNDASVFKPFALYLQQGRIEEAKKLITSANIHELHECGGLERRFGVLRHVANYGPDDPELIRHFVAMGAVGWIESMFAAAQQGKVKVVQMFLGLGVSIHSLDYRKRTLLLKALYGGHFKCAKILLDAGADLCASEEYINRLPKWQHKKHANIIPQWAYRFVIARTKARHACVIILMRRCCCGVNRDVMRIIARCVWSTRGHAKSWIKN